MVVGDDRRLPVAVDAGAGGGLGVKRDQPCDDAVQVLPPQLPPVRHFVHHALLGQAHHLQGVLQGVARTTQPDLPAVLRDGQDLQVDLRAEPPVQDQLFVQIMMAPAQGGEVEEAQVHRLLDLVGEAVGDEDPGDVGLDQVDGGSRLVIGRRLHQGCHEVHNQ